MKQDKNSDQVLLLPFQLESFADILQNFPFVKTRALETITRKEDYLLMISC